MSGETPLFSVRIADQNYVLNFSGDQIAEAIRRMIEFDPGIVGTTRINSTAAKPCDLDLIRSLGDYFIDYAKHSPYKVKDVVGLQLRVCQINNVLHQILYVKDEIYVRSVDTATDTFTEWDSFKFGTTIYDGNIPPVELEIGTLWVDTSGKLPQLKRYNGESWVQFAPVGPGETSEYIRNDVALTSDVAIVPTGIKAYDKSKGHLLLCFINSTIMIESTDYEVLEDGIHIKKVNGTWAGTAARPIMFTFILLVPGITVSGDGTGSGTSEETQQEINDLKARVELLQKYVTFVEEELKESGSSSAEEFEEIGSQINNISQEITDISKRQSMIEEEVLGLKELIGSGGVIGELPTNLVYFADIGESKPVNPTSLLDNLVTTEDESGTV